MKQYPAMPEIAMEMGNVLVGKYLGEKAALMKPPPPAEDTELKKRTTRVAGSDITNSWLEWRMGSNQGGTWGRIVALAIGWRWMAGSWWRKAKRHVDASALRHVTCALGHVICMNFFFSEYRKHFGIQSGLPVLLSVRSDPYRCMYMYRYR